MDNDSPLYSSWSSALCPMAIFFSLILIRSF